MTHKEYNPEATELIHKQIFESLERIETQTTLTNGKVKRMHIYLVAVAAFVFGLGIVEAKTILTIIL